MSSDVTAGTTRVPAELERWSPTEKELRRSRDVTGEFARVPQRWNSRNSFAAPLKLFRNQLWDHVDVKHK